VLPVTQTTSVFVPGYVQHDVPVPQAGHGQVVQAWEVKNAVQAPATQTWLAAHALPHIPQSSGLFWKYAWVTHAPLQN
jgi:hypothetical protein